MALTVEAAVRSHIGLVRRRNEDRAFAGQWLLAVADGLGGHVAGDIASSTVIEILRRHDVQVDPTDLSSALGRAIYAANEALRKEIESAPELAGMGTTVVALLWSATNAVVANVGDSRAYVLCSHVNGTSKMTQITEDHTYGNLVSDAADVPNLPARITRFLDGRTDGRSPDLTRKELHPGDRFLLCSDGLSAVVPLNLIQDTLASAAGLDEIADRLVTLALEAGGPDNITVVVLDIADVDR